MKQLLSFSLLVLLIPFSSFGQVLHGNTTVSSANNMTIDITVDVSQNEVTLVLTGPSTVWFGYGFGGTSMFNRYSIITTGSGAISERKLGNHNSGSLLASSLISSTTTVNGSIRTDTIRRAIAGMNSNYFSFPTTTGSFMLIWGKGNGSSLANHGGANRGSSMISLSPLCTSTSTALNDTTVCFGDSIQFAGQYINTAGQYVDTLTVAGGCDSILSQNISFSNPGPFAQPAVDICNGDSAIIFGNFQSVAGLYSDTIQTSTGCDSILTQQLAITVVDTSVTYIFGEFKLTAHADNATYQWLENCDSIPSPMAGETDSVLSFPTDTNAFYAVIITQNGCVDTSRCIHYFHVLSTDENQAILSSTYPNPFQDVLSIELNSAYQQARIQILDMSGKLIRDFSFNSGLQKLDLMLEDVNKGSYLMRVNLDGRIETQLIIKD